MGPPLSPAAMKKALYEAVDRYREHELADNDMVAAGGELARRVEDLLAGPVCGISREMLLREMAERADGDEPETDIPLDDIENDPYEYSDDR